MKKILVWLAALFCLGAVALWAKGYYNDRYVANELY